MTYIHLLGDGRRRQEEGGGRELGHLVGHELRVVDVFHQESEAALQGVRLRQKVPVVVQLPQRHRRERWVELLHFGPVGKDAAPFNYYDSDSLCIITD